MNRFSNFDPPSTQYPPNCFLPQYNRPNPNPFILSLPPIKPYELKEADGTIKGYFWYWGNSVDLKFNLEGEITLMDIESYIDIKDVLESLTFIGSIYDFRHLKILEFSNLPGAPNPLSLSLNPSLSSGNNDDNIDVKGSIITMSLTHELSSLLVKGVYYIDLVATHPSGYCATLFNADSCTFEVR